MMRVLSCGLFLLAVASCSTAAVAQSYITLDYPGAHGTDLGGIDGSNIVGSATTLPGGFLYNGSVFTQIVHPLGVNGTYPHGISGNNIVGYFEDSAGKDHGFVYNLSTSAYTTLDDPNAPSLPHRGTYAAGISGDSIVGHYCDSSSSCHGFMYNLSTSAYTTLDDPKAALTSPIDVSGNYVVGLYYDSAGDGHGFLYNVSAQNYTTLDDPLGWRHTATNGIAWYTAATGIDGNTVVGEYINASNSKELFLYDIPTATYTNLNGDPSRPIDVVGGISGNAIVGSYTAADGRHGLVATIATIPEPSTLSLLGIGAIGLVGFYWKRRAASLAEPTMIMSFPSRSLEAKRRAA